MDCFTLTLQSQHRSIQCWSYNQLVNVLEPLRQSQGPRFASFALTGRWFQHRRRETRAFAFQRRCFVVVLAGGMKPACGSSPADDGEPAEITRDRRASAILAEGACSCGRQPPPQSIVHVRAQIDAANGPAWAAPRYTGSDDQSLQPIQRWCSDWSKVRASEGDRQRARPSDYIPPGTWPVLHRSGVQVETVIHHITLPKVSPPGYERIMYE